MIVNKIAYQTQSLCPICLKKIDASIIKKGGAYIMKKSCPVHGTFETPVWKGGVPMEDWEIKKERAYIENPITQIENGCPYDCGLCKEHRQHTCTAVIEITRRCNLNCRFCFADSNTQRGSDLSIDTISGMYDSVMKCSGACNIQLSGGEPTVRDDLPEIIRLGKEKGFGFIQVNTNGIRLAESEKYVEELKSAGLDSVFLQFDGTDDGIYRKLRNRDLLAIKEKAVENCRKNGIGVILVPTLVPGVNTDNIGQIIEFALGHIKAVKGVHFQPVSYFGRIPHPPEDRDRITLPELMEEIEKQTDGKIKKSNLRAPQCENPFCSFHGSFIYRGNGNLLALAGGEKCSCAKKAEEGADKAKAYVSGNWSARPEEAAGAKKDAWDRILDSINDNSFSISAMAFQDVWNVDLNRIRDCCIHEVSPDGRLIPFCIYNITDTQGRSLYRK